MAYKVVFDHEDFDRFRTLEGARSVLAEGVTEYVLEFWREHPEVEPFTEEDVPAALIDAWYDWRDGLDGFYITDGYDTYDLEWDEKARCGWFEDWGDWWMNSAELVEKLRAMV